MSDAFADDQRDIRQLVLETKAALAVLSIAFLPFLAFGAAGLQRAALSRAGVVVWVDQRVNVVIHPRERMLQSSAILLQPFLGRSPRRIPEELR